MNFCGVSVNFKSPVKQITGFPSTFIPFLCEDKGKIIKMEKTNQSSLKQKIHMSPKDKGFCLFHIVRNYSSKAVVHSCLFQMNLYLL